MKTPLALSLLAVIGIFITNDALASNSGCETVCTCAVPCATTCIPFGSSQSTTCEAIGLACVESCPDQKLDDEYFAGFPRYSDEELVCR